MSATSVRRPVDTPTVPMIVSVDDHVVEPAHVWQVWLPERYRDRGPRIERRGLAGLKMVGPAIYEYEFDDDAPPCDIWFYEDLIVPHKRHVAAVGFDRDDMTMSPITYDEMRPGCYEPKARVDDMLMNHVDASLCFPTFPRFCGQTFLEAKDMELAMACVLAYNDWMVEEWCGESGGVLIPLTIVPLWDVAAAAAEVRRNAARGVHAVCFSEIPRTSACRASTPGRGIRSSPRARRRTPSCACTSDRRRRCRRRRPTRRRPSRQRSRSATRCRR